MKFYCILATLFITINACGHPNAHHSNQEIKQQNTNKTNTISMNSNIENLHNNPELVVQSLIAAMSENDGEKIRSLFHKNAQQAYGNGEWKSGKDFFSWLESDIIERKGQVDAPWILRIVLCQVFRWVSASYIGSNCANIYGSFCAIFGVQFIP